MPYKDTGTYIVAGTDEVQTILDDQIVKIQAMNASPFIKPFKVGVKAEGSTQRVYVLYGLPPNHWTGHTARNLLLPETGVSRLCSHSCGL
eukprot:363522-Chlamydomonas_euryale.AAC.7